MNPKIWQPLQLLLVAGMFMAIIPNPPTASASTLWLSPVTGHLEAEFRQPSSDWSAGHRGVDYATAVDQDVVATHSGKVVFSGMVVDRGLVTIEHENGLKSSVEPICPTVKVGDLVATGQTIGSACEFPQYTSHCGRTFCVHFAIRNQFGYLSPLLLIGGLSPSRLKPLDGRSDSPA